MSALTRQYSRFFVVTADASDGLEDGLFFDGVIDERFVAANTISRNPKGRDRRSSDHTVLEARVFEATLLVDRSPLEGFERLYELDTGLGLRFRSLLPEAPAGDRRLSEVFVALEGLRGRRLDLFTQRTGVLRGYQIKQVQHDADHRSDSRYRIHFEEVLDAYSETIFIPRAPEAKKQQGREECQTDFEFIIENLLSSEGRSLLFTATRVTGPNGETTAQRIANLVPTVQQGLSDVLGALRRPVEVR